VEVTCPEHADAALSAEVARVVGAVTAIGGAVGWVQPPSTAEITGWLDSLLTTVRAGRARLAVAHVRGRAEALGYWERLDGAVLEQNAEIRKVMVHPDARGRKLARVVVDALVDTARAAGIETVILDVRGNNPAAMALYERTGFVVYGRLPDFVAVGNERFDRVCYRRDLRPAGEATLARHGGRPVGPGWSATATATAGSPPSVGHT